MSSNKVNKNTLSFKDVLKSIYNSVDRFNFLSMFLTTIIATTFVIMTIKFGFIEPQMLKLSSRLYSLENDFYHTSAKTNEHEREYSEDKVDERLKLLEQNLNKVYDDYLVTKSYVAEIGINLKKIKEDSLTHIEDDKVILTQAKLLLNLANKGFYIHGDKNSSLSLLNDVKKNIEKSSFKNKESLIQVIEEDKKTISNYDNNLDKTWKKINQAISLVPKLTIKQNLILNKSTPSPLENQNNSWQNNFNNSLKTIKDLVKVHKMENNISPLLDSRQMNMVTEKTYILLEELRWFTLKGMQENFDLVLFDLKEHVKKHYDFNYNDVNSFYKIINCFCGNNSATLNQKPRLNSLKYLIENVEQGNL